MSAYESLACFLLGFFIRWLAEPRRSRVPVIRIWTTPYPTIVTPLDGTKMDVLVEEGAQFSTTKTPVVPS